MEARASRMPGEHPTKAAISPVLATNTFTEHLFLVLAYSTEGRCLLTQEIQKEKQAGIQSVNSNPNKTQSWSSMIKWLLFQRAQVHFPATTWQLTTICNSSSRASDALSGLGRYLAHHVVLRHTKRQNTHTFKNKISLNAANYTPGPTILCNWFNLCSCMAL